MRNLIQYQMKEQHLTAKDMAKALGVSESTWRRWLRKPEERISLGMLWYIGTVLDLSDEDFLKLINKGAA